jgi:hypothetical protein
MYCRHNTGNEEAIQDLLYCSYYTNLLYSDCCYIHCNHVYVARIHRFHGGKQQDRKEEEQDSH